MFLKGFHSLDARISNLSTCYPFGIGQRRSVRTSFILHIANLKAGGVQSYWVGRISDCGIGDRRLAVLFVAVYTCR